MLYLPELVKKYHTTLRNHMSLRRQNPEDRCNNST